MEYADYRPYLPKKNEGRLAGETAEEHTAARLKTKRAQQIIREWDAISNQPFKGITTDGNIKDDLFELEDSGAPTKGMCEAAWGLLNSLTPEQRRKTQHPVGSPVWLRWQNSEMYVEDYGLRLENVSPDIRSRVLNVLAASLSEEGYATSLGVMQLNAFLGQVLKAPGVMNEWSYSIVIYGVPSLTEPWGWQFFGHHLVLNCMVVGGQMTLTPSFHGAEIVYADQGPFKGLELFKDHERLGLEFMNSLSKRDQERAVVGRSMTGEDLPEGRVHLADYLHLGGAHQDNRIVPYEGLPLGAMEGGQQQKLLDLVNEYICLLPEGPRQARMEEFERYMDDTHFCWIGGNGPDDPFYYRIQSPVVFIEFDHHPGMFLTNRKPLKYHIHTIVRTPNGNDYGIDLLRQHYKNSHKHGHSHDHD